MLGKIKIDKKQSENYISGPQNGQHINFLKNNQFKAYK